MNSAGQGAGQAPSSRRGRRYLLRLLWIAGVVAALMLVGAVYEAGAETSDARMYAPPGQLVDVGGHRLHINCRGTGSPSVVIDAGLGDWSTIWGSVQAEVGKTTRVCTYDRAGMGWSEPGPLPRDARQFAKELQALLQNAGIPGPYVLVGHSMGGLPARVFAHDHPAEVAGVVLIESMVPRQFSQPSAAARSQSESQSEPSSVLAGLARFGVIRILGKPLGIVPDLLRDDQAYYSRLVRPENIQAYTDEMQGMPASAAEASAVRSFGGIPLIVLTARVDSSSPKDWQAWQTELLQLSTSSQQLYAEKSGHNIEVEEPQAAVAAIIQMVRQVRRATGQ